MATSFIMSSEAFKTSRMEPNGHLPVQPNIRLYVCQEPGCYIRSFKRIGDLRRHSRSHDLLQRFPCPASGCNRVGKRGFARADKLVDHMLAGHDENDWFSCASCGWSFVRAEYEVHLNLGYHKTDRVDHASGYRTCPQPRCSFKVHIGHRSSAKIDKLDMLQEHLLEKHDMQARSHFACLLEQKGYDAQTCEVICPACPLQPRFKKHSDFENHFWHTHFQGPSCFEHEAGLCNTTCSFRHAYWRIKKCTSIPDELIQHRLAILRIWPPFGSHPVWIDVKNCEDRI